MSFFATLQASTAVERDYLYSAPIIVDALRGDITRAQYVAFLKEAYFHVKQTVPLLMACGSRLPDDKEWLRGAVAHYIDDEYGHEKWILNDIRACGGDPDLIRNDEPSLATELMVSYAFDTINRRNPVGFFGMVFVLEGTSVALATQAANTLQQKLELPEEAFSYLLSHGSIDQGHVKFLESLVDRFDNASDQAEVIHCARRFFYLYAQIFRSLPDRKQASVRPDLRAVA
jgi:pyrroloquinoline quinone (PQQ) biosynthesis protein C